MAQRLLSYRSLCRGIVGLDLHLALMGKRNAVANTKKARESSLKVFLCR